MTVMHRPRADLVRLPLLIVAVVLLVLLSGCASAPQLVQVRVPVPVECRVATPARPAMPTDAIAPGATLATKVGAALAELEIREGYEGELRAALEACTAPVAAP